jgi:L-ascorbate metabolism protein UlaG (beta-lactamase superfamily)
MRSLEITWLGHGTFLLGTPGGKRLLFDPFLTDNPACPDAYRQAVGPLDAILVTHAHGDHFADTVRVARATGAPVVANFELCTWLERKGLTALQPMNIGGTIDLAGLKVTMTMAVHSSTLIDETAIIALGPSCGFVLQLEDGLVAYFAGDTALFGDMRLIGELYQPRLAFLPIGDRFTMGPEQAAHACRLLGIERVVPMHYGTWPGLTGTPAALRALLASDVTVLELRPGETAR